jgi:hypothetical protein
MVKREVFEEVGRFTEDYFMYAEDIDLCYKINQTERKVHFVDGAEVLHHGGGSSSVQANSFQNVLTRESVFRFIFKTRGRLSALAYRIAMLLTAGSRLLLLLPALPPAALAGRSGRLWNIFCKWKSILRWSLGLEKWARELR